MYRLKAAYSGAGKTVAEAGEEEVRVLFTYSQLLKLSTRAGGLGLCTCAQHSQLHFCGKKAKMRKKAKNLSNSFLKQTNIKATTFDTSLGKSS